ncbi:MAG TPA: ABC transporter permease [Pseudomonadales bacterium]|nr:ABC transporter permease [Pseudomonadales bacterium]
MTTMEAIRPAAVPLHLVAGIRWRSVAALWRRHIRALARVWKVAITWFLVEPGIVLLALALGIGRLVGDMGGGLSYAEFVAPGIIIGTAMFHALFEASWSAFQRINESVYETALTAPVTVAEVVLAELLFAATRASISTLAVSLFAVAFGWLTPAAIPGLLLLSLGVGGVFGGIGQLFAALSPSMHSLSMVFTLVATPMYFFSGAFFPIEVLPDWLEPVAWAMPLTALVELARGFAVGDLTLVHLWCALWVTGLSALLYPLAVRCMGARLLK